MEDGNSIIYGLEHQTRALAPQLGDTEAIRFLIGTQNLKPNSNQIHVVELEEETGALHTKVFNHPLGEVWHLRCSPNNAATFVTTHNRYDPDKVQCVMASSLCRLSTTRVIPKDLDDLSPMHSKQIEDVEVLKTFKPEKLDHEVRCAEFHPTEETRLAVVTESAINVFDLNSEDLLSSATPAGKAHLKFHAGKWNPHHNAHQFAAIQDNHIKCFDMRRDCKQPAWSLESVHDQLARDLDFNPLRQFLLATVGDDGKLNIWDYRSKGRPVFTRSDHSHWAWTVRYNSYHDQLLLTGGSDGRALLTSAVSVSSEAENESNGDGRLKDGVLQSYEQHEDSVYCLEWSSIDPWTFASLSYDGRLLLSKLPHKAWTVRYNSYHDQLLLTGGSDGRALLTSAVSVSSEAENESNGDGRLKDGVLQSYEQHEDSVYCLEWSSIDPWTFASLSYDGRLLLSKLPHKYKHAILAI